MTIKAANWVGEYTITTGTGPITLAGAVRGFARFNVMGDGQVYYVIQDGIVKETGLGTLTGDVLERTTIHATIDANGVYSQTPVPIDLSGNAQVYGIVNAAFMQELYNNSSNVFDAVGDVQAAADAAAASEANAKTSEINAKNSEIAALTAEQIATSSAASAAQSSADALTAEQKVEEMVEIVQLAVGLVAGAASYPYPYTVDQDNITTLVMPSTLEIVTIPAIYVEGQRNEKNYGYEYDEVTRTITFAQPLNTGDFITIMITGKASDIGTAYPQLMASSAGAGLVGTKSGNTVQVELDNLNDSVLNISGVSLALLPRLCSKLVSYRHGVAGYQSVYRFWGFGSSVGNGASIGGKNSPDTPIAKFFEFFNNTVNRSGIYPTEKQNYSVDGSSINDFLNRDWDAALASGNTPDVVLFAYGMNDFPTALYNAGATFGENGFKECLRNAIRKVKEAGADVVLTTTPHPRMGAYSWSMPPAVPQIWPSASPAPVSDDDIIPKASESGITIKWNGKNIFVAHRFLRGNDAIRQVSVEEECVLLDSEHFWFDALAKYGEDALFDDVPAYQTVHPNLLGHKESYQKAEKIFFNAMDKSAFILPAPSKHRVFAVGGTALAPQPLQADVDLMANNVRAKAYVRRDKNARIIEEVTQTGKLTRTAYTVADPTPSAPGYNVTWNEEHTRVKGLFAANETYSIPIVNRTTVRIFIDVWTSSHTDWTQAYQLIVSNREGVVSYKVIGSLDTTPGTGGSGDISDGSRLFTIAAASNNLVITILNDNSSLKIRTEGFGV
ncbi:SGNH/GDSL hydrolase family protein [Klebsiella pneumoniae]|nr:SGNH/GDSL hydrolase family protein [Klebsiella pneumoniae]